MCVCVCVCVCHGHYGFDISSQIKQHLHCTFRFHLRRCFKSLSVKQYGLIRLVWGISVQRRVKANARIIAFYGGIFSNQTSRKKGGYSSGYHLSLPLTCSFI